MTTVHRFEQLHVPMEHDSHFENRTSAIFHVSNISNIPCGRGIFHNPTKTVLCWCNEEDHCRIVAMENGGDVKGVFTRFSQLSNAIKAAAESTSKKLMEHPNYGFQSIN